MLVPYFLKRMFFPKRRPEDRPDPHRHEAKAPGAPAESGEEVLARAAASQNASHNGGSPAAAGPMKDTRDALERDTKDRPRVPPSRRP